MKLLCDEMLGGLARWLRAAGHDTALAEPQARDARLIEQALREQRVLVSRDRRLVQEAGRRTAAVLLTADHLDEQARQLGEALALDWTLSPFTRCMVDNTLLRAATDEERLRIPPGPRSLSAPERACPCCGRLFWPGSHVRSMLARLQAWRAMTSAPGNPSAGGGLPLRASPGPVMPEEEPPIAPDPVVIPGQDPPEPEPGPDLPDPPAPPELEPGGAPLELPGGPPGAPESPAVM